MYGRITYPHVKPLALSYSYHQRLVDVVIVLKTEPELFQVVGALHTSSRLTRRLNGGKKQTNQNADDGNDNQKFNQGETLKLLGASEHI